MKKLNRLEVALTIITLFFIVFLLSGVESVPFHPDESSLLYQSRDLEALFNNPSSLVWSPDRSGELDQTYRLLNPPIPKYILGLGRMLAGFDSEDVNVDWNWSASWEENVAASALPDPNLLHGARIASTVVLLGSLLPLTAISRKLAGNKLAIITVLLFGINSLVLLHGRRAMAEGSLIFGTSLAILGLLEAGERPWLTGVGVAVALSSKLSAGALLPIGLIAVLWPGEKSKEDLGPRIRRGITYSIVVILITLILNPILWANPVGGISRIWNSRVDFAERQKEIIESFSPGQLLETPTQRFAGMLVMLYIRPPQTSEVANYIEQTESDEEAYLAHPLNTLTSGIIVGSLTMLLTTIGIGSASLELIGSDAEKKRKVALLILGTFGQVIAILAVNAIPFQRYYLPLLPFILIWMAIALRAVPTGIKKAAQKMGGLRSKQSSPYSRK